MSGEIVPFDGGGMLSRTQGTMPAGLPERLQALTAATELVPVDLDVLNAEELFQLGVKAFQSSTVRMAYAGHCWALAKERSGGGRAWIEARAAEAHISASHIYNAIKVLEQLLRAPDELSKQFGRFDYTKLLLLANLDDQDLDDLVDHGQTQAGVTLEEIKALSVRDLAARLRKTSDTEYRLRRELRQANLTVIDQRQQLEAIRHPLSEQLPHSVATARAEGPALAQALQPMIGRLLELCVAVVKGIGLPTDHLQRQALLRDGLGPPVAALRLIHAEVTGALADLNDAVGHYLPDLGTITPLSADEVHASQQLFDGLYSRVREQQMLTDKADRARRAAAKPSRKRRQ